MRKRFSIITIVFVIILGTSVPAVVDDEKSDYYFFSGYIYMRKLVADSQMTFRVLSFP